MKIKNTIRLNSKKGILKRVACISFLQICLLAGLFASTGNEWNGQGLYQTNESYGSSLFETSPAIFEASPAMYELSPAMYAPSKGGSITDFVPINGSLKGMGDEEQGVLPVGEAYGFLFLLALLYAIVNIRKHLIKKVIN